MGPKFSCNRDFCQLLQKDFANMKENNSYIINTPPDPRYPFAFKVNHLWKEGRKKKKDKGDAESQLQQQTKPLHEGPPIRPVHSCHYIFSLAWIM